jgi:hypothetical protein
MRYAKGSKVNCRATFIDPVTQAAVDPLSVTFRLENPSGQESVRVYGQDSTVERLSAGNYRVAVSADQSGPYAFRFESTGDFQGAAEGLFEVERSDF